ncbi:MAG: NINE protein [Bdellovibrionaceae bacterium]|nr:NINE protein [Pseudobdellovibrionaceae bacterium]
MFLGGFGAHRFYMNRPVTGIFYLFFFWTFIPALIAFFEALSLAFFWNDEEFRRHVNDPRVVAPNSAADDLGKLAALFEKNLVTKEEYEAKKAILLQRIT